MFMDTWISKKNRSYIIYQACPKKKFFEIISRNVSSSLIRSELGSLTVVCNNPQLLYSHFKTCIVRLKHCLNMNKYLRNVYCVRKSQYTLIFFCFHFSWNVKFIQKWNWLITSPAWYLFTNFHTLCVNCCLNILKTAWLLSVISLI